MSWKFGEWGWRLLPGSIAAVTIAALLKLTALQPLEQIAYRAMFQLRGELPWDDRIVVIAIDDSSIQQLGRFPWSRQQYTQLLKRITPAEPSVIVVDLLWSENSWDDSPLADVLAQQGRVILARAWDATGVPLVPVAELRDAAIDTGHIMKREDSDGIVRKIDPLLQDQLALSFAALQSYALVQAPVPLPDPGRPLWINWAGRAKQIPQYAFADVVKGKIPPEAFQDKIVLIGVTATGIDPLISPFNRTPPDSSVHLHATAIYNLLQQNYLKPIGQGWFPLLLLLGGPGLSLVMMGWSTRQQLIVMFGLCFGWGGIGLLLLKATYLIPIAAPLTLFVFTGVAVAISERLRENFLLQNKIQQLWQTYQQDLISPVAAPIASLKQPKRSGLLEPTVSSMSRLSQLTTLAEQFGRSQSTQAAIARSLSVGLAAADLDGHIWFCNPAATDWLNLQLGCNLKTQLVPQWLSQEQWQANLHNLRQGQPSASQELDLKGRWVELKLEPLVYQAEPHSKLHPETSLKGVLLVLEDITARKQIEENLNRQVQELNQISLLKDDFLSTVSHELRAPMANIKMATYMLRVATSPEQHEHYLRILQDECTRETDLINDLLDLQRLESGIKDVKAEKFYLQEWLPQLIEPFYARAENRQQILELCLPTDLPPIVSDQSSLGRLLTELINNACKYTPPEQTIRVSAQFLDSALEIRVSNFGVEIPEAERTKIFDKFYRIPKNDRWKQGGTGLGLALVKRLAEHLGGIVQVESGTEETTFSVQLPVSE
jgi:signal transduction histidine kinase/CHASE2 domain-containing sensor protein